MFYSRKIYPDLLDHIDKKPITVITGMRRTGKTTLLKQLLGSVPGTNKLYLDLQRVDVRELFKEKNYDALINNFEQHGVDRHALAYVALDEIQLVPSMPEILKYLYDHYKIKFLVSGSSFYYLKNLFSESLAGRKKIFELFPLDFGEFLTFKGILWKPQVGWTKRFDRNEYARLKNFYEEYIEFGGFPEVVLSRSLQDKQDLLADILSSYVNIDIATLADFRNKDAVSNLMKLLASRVGSRLDVSKLASIIGVTRITLASYLDFLEQTYVVTRLPVVSRNPEREIVKAKKIYFCDNGLLGALASVSSGVKFENAIFNQLRQVGKLSYYARKTGEEIDFVLGDSLALEVKESPTASDLRTLRRLTQALGISNSRLIGRYETPKFTDYIWGGEIR